MVSLKSCSAPQPLRLLPADVCPPLRDFLQVLWAGSAGSFAATRSGKWMSLQGRTTTSATWKAAVRSGVETGLAQSVRRVDRGRSLICLGTGRCYRDLLGNWMTGLDVSAWVRPAAGKDAIAAHAPEDGGWWRAL